MLQPNQLTTRRAYPFTIKRRKKENFAIRIPSGKFQIVEKRGRFQDEKKNNNNQSRKRKIVEKRGNVFQ